MDELAKAFSRFLTRDVVYVIGGSSMIFSFLYMFSQFDKDVSQNVLSLFSSANSWVSAGLILWTVGITWILGYGIQELSSLTHRTANQYPKTFPPWIKWLFRRFTYREWEIEHFDTVPARFAVNEQASEQNKADLERLLTLKQIGTTMGPCAFVSCVLLFIRFISAQKPLDFVLAVICLVLGILFVCLGWIKLMQEVEFLFKFTMEHRKDKTPP